MKIDDARFFHISWLAALILFVLSVMEVIGPWGVWAALGCASTPFVLLGAGFMAIALMSIVSKDKQ